MMIESKDSSLLFHLQSITICPYGAHFTHPLDFLKAKGLAVP